jgi:hypothetical protein
MRIMSGYGLSMDEYDRMLTAQNNACWICKCNFDRTPHVDHCHTTGAVRGLLCSNCNKGIGLLKDDPRRLLAAFEYLTRTRTG